MKKRIIFGFLAITLFFAGLVWADANGIWHRAEDVRVGIFGDDEGDDTTSYVFNNPVTFNKVITIGDIIEDQDDNTYYVDPSANSKMDTLDVQVIRSGTDGNVIIQLG